MYKRCADCKKGFLNTLRPASEGGACNVCGGQEYETPEPVIKEEYPSICPPAEK